MMPNLFYFSGFPKLQKDRHVIKIRGMEIAVCMENGVWEKEITEYKREYKKIKDESKQKSTLFITLLNTLFNTLFITLLGLRRK